MKSLIKITSLFILLLWVGVSEMKATEVTGKYGSLHWSFNTESGELTISGKGKINDFKEKYYGRDEIYPAWYSFRDKVKSITIQEGVISIGCYAFNGCKNAVSISIPSSLQLIREGAFKDCIQLKSIYISDLSKFCRLKKSGSYTSPFCYASDLYLNNQLITNLIIPEDVEYIGSTFSGCQSIQSVTISKNVLRISESAFNNCKNITSIIWNAKKCKGYPWGNGGVYNRVGVLATQIKSFSFGSDVEEIPANLCRGFVNLTTLALPSSVKKIGNNAFSECTNLNDVYITDLSAYCNIEFEKEARINGYYVSQESDNRIKHKKNVQYYFHNGTLPLYYANLYLNNELITDLIIPDDVKVIGHHFDYCKSIKSVTLHKEVQQIGIDNTETAFKGCKNLTKIYWNVAADIPFFLSKDERKQITEFIFGNTVTHIPDGCCRDMTEIESISLPKGVISIGLNAFQNCSNLKEIHLPSTLKYIGKGAFAFTKKLRHVYIDDLASYCNVIIDGIEENNNRYLRCKHPLIWANLYINNKLVTDLCLPDGIKNIDSRFSYCKSIKTIQIPNSVTTISDYAFMNCYNLQSINLPTTIKSIGKEAFGDCIGLVSVYVPNTIPRIGEDAFKHAGNIEYYGQISAAPWGAYCLNGYSDGRFVYKDASKKELIRCSPAITGDLVIPEEVSRIGNGTFSGCNSLHSITILNDNCIIATDAFSNCQALDSIILPATLEYKLLAKDSDIQIVHIPMGKSELKIIPESIEFLDLNNNKSADVNEPCSIRFKIQNTGSGGAIGCRALVSSISEDFIHIPTETKIPDLPTNKSIIVNIPFYTDSTASAITIPIHITISDINGISDSCIVNVLTTSFIPPKVIAQHSLSSYDFVAQKAVSTTLSLSIQNLGEGFAKNIVCKLDFPSSIDVSSNEVQRSWDILKPGGREELKVVFTAKESSMDTINIKYQLSELYGKYANGGIIPIVFGSTPTNMQMISNTDIQIAIKEPLQQLDVATIATMYSEWYKKYKRVVGKREDIDYSLIHVILEGNPVIINQVKNTISLKLSHSVNGICTKEVNASLPREIWFLIPIQTKWIELLCGENTPITLWDSNDELIPNGVYETTINIQAK